MTQFENWKNNLTVEDFEFFLVEVSSIWDCESLCPARNACKYMTKSKVCTQLCQCPEEFIKWANSEVNNNEQL